jgi:hypothetical protein
MAQVADSIEWWSNALIEYSEDGETWTEISQVLASVDPSGGDRRTGEVSVFGADSDVIGTGARQPVEITFRLIFENSATGTWQVIQDAYEDNSDIYFRWFPGGGNEGDVGMQSNAGRIVRPPHPAQGDASNAAPLSCEFMFRTDEINAVVYAAS